MAVNNGPCVFLQQRFGIKTAGLDDKCTAMQMLVVYAKDLKDGFADYAETVSDHVTSHVIYMWSVLVRSCDQSCDLHVVCIGEIM